MWEKTLCILASTLDCSMYGHIAVSTDTRDMTTDSHELCSQQCTLDATCVYWTWFHEENGQRGHCRLSKDTTGHNVQLYDISNDVSGEAFCHGKWFMLSMYTIKELHRLSRKEGTHDLSSILWSVLAILLI